MGILRLFSPNKKNRKGSSAGIVADRHKGLFYYYHDQRILHAVNVALATSRPLMVRGPSGCGKSSLAFNIAQELGLRYYEFVVHSRAIAQNLKWRFDAVRRLGDVHTFTNEESENGTQQIWRNTHAYLEPGVLWWAFDPKNAKQRGYGDLPEKYHAKDPFETYNRDRQAKNAVVLIDEIDKADPDFANDLLVPFGAYEFAVSETQTTVALPEQGERKPWEWAPFLIITTNNERTLPDAFLRRCLILDLGFPEKEDLACITYYTLFPDHEGEPKSGQLETYLEIMAKLEKTDHWPCSIPEFIDLARARQHLGLKISEITDELFNLILNREQE